MSQRILVGISPEFRICGNDSYGSRQCIKPRCPTVHTMRKLSSKALNRFRLCLTEAPYGKEKKNARESGTYDELIENNGKFAELVERQRLDVEAD